VSPLGEDPQPRSEAGKLTQLVLLCVLLGFSACVQPNHTQLLSLARADAAKRQAWGETEQEGGSKKKWNTPPPQTSKEGGPLQREQMLWRLAALVPRAVSEGGFDREMPCDRDYRLRYGAYAQGD